MYSMHHVCCTPSISIMKVAIQKWWSITPNKPSPPPPPQCNYSIQTNYESYTNKIRRRFHHYYSSILSDLLHSNFKSSFHYNSQSICLSVCMCGLLTSPKLLEGCSRNFQGLSRACHCMSLQIHSRSGGYGCDLVTWNTN